MAGRDGDAAERARMRAHDEEVRRQQREEARKLAERLAEDERLRNNPDLSR